MRKSGDPVSDDTAWQYTFDAELHRQIEALKNQPPPPPHPPIVYGALLTALRWTPAQFDAAVALNFPKPIAQRYTSHGGSVSGRENAYAWMPSTPGWRRFIERPRRCRRQSDGNRGTSQGRRLPRHRACPRAMKNADDPLVREGRSHDRRETHDRTDSRHVGITARPS